MSRYRGPATLIGSGGAEVEVYVDLRSKQREWSGTATIGDAGAADDDSLDRTLRLPDGREAQVTLGGSAVWSDVTPLVGSGPPPFG
ncbi:DUF4873 domain-containing protein [Actinomadura sp. NAK00032]|uniref:DUF4873 domain-containing protein n=1 Tax=Actinomadura sp. NAK00032 TaxID=2742128 RepID=UPI00158FEF2D|nr:DUF4873 domain-containing protein [Actinomadura sp. NAK00032]QKW33494.1 DUF4873 domain-containing protein [Actinomadura sp. NAK00032]